jgi:hypothetical protein
MGDFQRGLTIMFVMIGALALLSLRTNAQSPAARAMSDVA